METVTIPKKEYELLREAYAILRDTDFIHKLNRLTELVLAEKWEVVMPEDTSDLTEAGMNNVAEWKVEGSTWDGV